jgi:hypothetical protein
MASRCAWWRASVFSEVILCQALRVTMSELDTR